MFCFCPGIFLIFLPILYQMAAYAVLSVFISPKCYCWIINKHIMEFRINLFGKVLLYVKISGMFFFMLIFSLFCKVSFRSVKSTLPICLFKLSSFYFLSKHFYFITSQSLFYSSSIEHIVFNLKVCLYCLYYFLMDWDILI